MNTINGYIEINGVINKVTSVEDLKRVAESLGKEFTEMTREELEKMCHTSAHKSYIDDCGIVYDENNVLWESNEKSYDLDQYKIREGTIAISDEAFLIQKVKGSNVVKEPRIIKELYIPSSVIAIGEYAFRYNHLSRIKWSNSLQYIGRGAFWKKASAQQSDTLILPRDLRFLGAKAFQGWQNIGNVIFNNKIQEIGSSAFKGCTCLKTVYIPQNIISVGSGLFENCPNFKTIYIPTGSMEKFKEFFPFDIDKLVEVDDVPDFDKQDND